MMDNIAERRAAQGRQRRTARTGGPVLGCNHDLYQKAENGGYLR